MCSCGPSTYQLPNFAELENCDVYRLGWNTDFRKAREILGDRHIRATLDPARIARGDEKQAERDVIRLIEETGIDKPLSVCLINASAETPDENIRVIYSTVAKYGLWQE